MNRSLEGKHVVLVVCSFELGGAEKQALHLARYLLANNVRVSVLSTLPGEGLVARVCEKEGVPFSSVRFLWPCRKWSLVKNSWLLRKELKRLKPDVILPFTGSPNVGCGLVFPWLNTSVCLWGQRNVHDMRGSWIERKAIHNTSGIICNAAHEVAYLESKFGQLKKPVRVIPNGLELEPPIQNRYQWRERLNLEQDAIVVTMLANLRPAKDHETLLKAWNRLIQSSPVERPPIHLVLAGARQHSADTVENMTKEMGLLGKSVHLVGQIEDVSGLLKASDIGVLTSPSEGLSNAVIEYMASGLPVVATDNSGNREALGTDYPLDLPEQGNFDDVADALESQINDDESRRQIGTRNQKEASARFSIDKMCNSVCEFILEQWDL